MKGKLLKLLFYHGYEQFYKMAETSECFRRYCVSAYGADFSQDGFSDVDQVDLIFSHLPQAGDPHILDIGCGNGKMLKYLQRRVGGHIYGFDYSGNAINAARADHTANSDFRVGTIGKVEYPEKLFDLIVSMDTMYFAEDMGRFAGQVRGWLKDDGVFFVGYQEGDIMAKTDNSETTVLAKALRKNGFRYDVIDYTRQTYDMLTHKRKTILAFRDDFIRENHQRWYSIILNQTNSAVAPFEEFRRHNARYIFVARK